jgi:hypothetical protein
MKNAALGAKSAAYSRDNAPRIAARPLFRKATPLVLRSVILLLASAATLLADTTPVLDGFDFPQVPATRIST